MLTGLPLDFGSNNNLVLALYTYVQSLMYYATRVLCTYLSMGGSICTYKIISMCFSGNSSVGYLGGCVVGRSAQH